MSRRLWIFTLGFFLWAGVTAAQEEGIPGTIYQTVNVRSQPGARYEIVGQLNTGDSVTVTGRDSEKNEWLLVVASGGITGWVASFVVLLEGDIAALPLIDTDANPDNLSTEVMVTAYGRVNIRSGPGMAYELIGQLEIGAEAWATARSNEDNDWLYVELEEVQGWVAYFTVQVSGNPDELPIRLPDGTGEALVRPEALITARFNIRLHAEPTLNSVTVIIVPFNSLVIPLARTEDGRWLYVGYADVVGWGATRLFDISDDRVLGLPIFVPLETAPEITPAVESTLESTAELTAEATIEVTPEAVNTPVPEATIEMTPEILETTEAVG